MSSSRAVESRDRGVYFRLTPANKVVCKLHLILYLPIPFNLIVVLTGVPNGSESVTASKA